MPSEMTDQRRLPSVSSSFFSEEIRFPAQRKVGFWKSEVLPDNFGNEDMTLMSESKSIGSSPFEKYNSTGVSMSWKSTECDLGQHSTFVQLASLSGKERNADLNGFPYENGLFSTSLPETFDKRSTNCALFDQYVGMTNSNNEEDEPFESLKEIEAQTIGNLLPDDDELLSDVVDERECVAPPNGMNDVEDDLFCSIGGLELEASTVSNAPKNEMNNSFGGNPYGEHPSRTLFVGNINSSTEDSDLRVLFEQYGDIYTLFTASKHHGFIVVSYYDIRSACNAMRALQNKIFMHRKFDIRFSIPKENAPHKDINQRAFVVANLDSSLSNDDLRHTFGVYGEIKEVCESPKRHEKFIEFYDVRAAEAARCALKRSGIAKKQIMPESSHILDARCLSQQYSYNLKQEPANGCHKKGCSPSSSPSLHYGHPHAYTSGTIPFGANTSSGLDNGAIQGKCSVSQGRTGLLLENGFSRNSSSVPHYLSSPVRISSMGNHSNQAAVDDLSHSLGQMSFGFRNMSSFRPHSLPDYHDGLSNTVPFNSPSTASSLALNIAGQAEGVDKMHSSVLNSAGFCSPSLANNDFAFGTSGNSSCHLHGHQYLLNNSNSHSHLPHGPLMWSSSPSFMNNIPTHPASQLHGLPMAPSNIFNSGVHLHHHHVGSAPAANPSLWERRRAYKGDVMEATAFHPGSLENMGLSGSSNLHPLEFSPHSLFPHVGGNCLEPSISSPHVGLTSPQQTYHVFHGGRSPKIPIPATFGTPVDRFRSRRSDTSLNQADNRKQYELDIECIIRGEDKRTTLMIKNIPNKYTSKMLLAAIDEHHRGTYDFIYLPIDFKNKCNVGYAFINIIDPQQIIPFYKAFNGKKWEKFNSEKVASLAYARIQGKAALIAHFQNSSLMNEDKRCRPILFHSDGPNAGDQEPFPVGVNIRSRSGRPRTQNNEDSQQGSPSNSSNGEEPSNELQSTADSLEGLNE